jgi:hypothetical protein
MYLTDHDIKTSIRFKIQCRWKFRSKHVSGCSVKKTRIWLLHKKHVSGCCIKKHVSGCAFPSIAYCTESQIDQYQQWKWYNNSYIVPKKYWQFAH